MYQVTIIALFCVHACFPCFLIVCLVVAFVHFTKFKVEVPEEVRKTIVEMWNVLFLLKMSDHTKNALI